MEQPLQAVGIIPDEDRLLCQRIRSGDEAAFAHLYARHKQPVYVHCVRFLGRGAAAEDVFQEVFMRCFEKLRDGAEIANLRGYLLTCVHHRCLNIIRDRKYPADIDDVCEQVAIDSLDPAEHMDLEQALAVLPSDLREALLLSEYQGFTYEEIAGMTGVPTTTIRKRIFRARQRLRLLLAPTRNGGRT